MTSAWWSFLDAERWKKKIKKKNWVVAFLCLSFQVWKSILYREMTYVLWIVDWIVDGTFLASWWILEAEIMTFDVPDCHLELFMTFRHSCNSWLLYSWLVHYSTFAGKTPEDALIITHQECFSTMEKKRTKLSDTRVGYKRVIKHFLAEYRYSIPRRQSCLFSRPH